MANAKRDQNNVPTLLATLNTDGKTPVPVLANAVAHGMKSSINAGVDNGKLPASRDENRVPVMMAVSSVDGVTPVEIYADSVGNLLLQTT